MKKMNVALLFIVTVFAGCANLQTTKPVIVEDEWTKSSAVQPVAVQVQDKDGKTATQIKYLPLEYSKSTRQFRIYIEPEKPAAADTKTIAPKVEPKPVAPKQ